MQNDPNNPQTEQSPPKPQSVVSPQGGAIPNPAPHTPEEQQKVAAYYEQLRRGKRDFDPQTASALLMKLDMEEQARDRTQNVDRKNVSLMTALIFPWRMFNPAMRPTNGTRMVVILVFFVLLTFVLPLLIAKLFHVHGF
ncbi:MAG: hypothetical protein ACQR33_02860 [Candidatus Saccharibacteria bacterium]